MRFDYQMYLKSDLYVPIGYLLFSIGFIGLCLAGAFLQSGKSLFEELIPVCFPVCIALFFIYISVTQLIRGVPLLKDRDQETFEVSGIVEKIEGFTFSTRHAIGRDFLSSIYITINGERYYSVSVPEIQEGDYLKLDVLKNSKFVAGYEKVFCEEI